MKEIWKDIIGYEGLYQISNMGRVKALSVRKLRGIYYHTQPEKIMKLNTSGKRYYNVQLSRDNINKYYSVHRLVATHFVPNIENKSTVNHIDGDRYNNCYSNLEWCTVKENIHHALRTGLKKAFGENHKHSKLKNEDVLFIRSSTKPNIELATKYSVYITTIQKIRKIQTWKHI